MTSPTPKCPWCGEPMNMHEYYDTCPDYEDDEKIVYSIVCENPDCPVKPLGRKTYETEQQALAAARKVNGDDSN